MQYLERVEQGNILDGERDLLSAENLEVLYQMGLATQAVDFSERLAQQSKDILQNILDFREEEREARKKTAINHVLSSITTGLSIASKVFSFIPALAPLSVTLKAISGALRAVQAAANGDWLTAIYSGAMTVINVRMDTVGQDIAETQRQLEKTNTLIETARESANLEEINALQTTIGDLQTSLETFQNTVDVLQNYESIASLSFQSIQTIQSGGDISDLLSILSNVGQVIANGIDLSDTEALQGLPPTRQAIITAGQLSQVVQRGIDAFDHEDWGEFIQVVGGITSTISTNFGLDLENQVKDFIVDLVGIDGGWPELEQFIENGEAILDGINHIENGQWLGVLQSIVGSFGNIGEILDIEFQEGSLAQKLVEEISELNLETIERVLETGEIIHDLGEGGISLQTLGSALTETIILWDQDSEMTQVLTRVNLNWNQLGKIAQTSQLLGIALEAEQTEVWKDTLRNIISIWDQDEALSSQLKNKIQELTQLEWEQIEGIIQTGGIIDDVLEQGTLRSVGDALQDIIAIWQDDESLTQALTGANLSWETIGKIAQSSQKLGTALESRDNQDWGEILKDIAQIWGQDEILESKLKNKIKELTNLDWEQIELLIESGDLIDDALEQKDFKAVGNALKQIIDLWQQDADETGGLAKIGLDWTQLSQVAQSSLVLGVAIEADDSEVWIKTFQDLFGIWDQDAQLQTKLKTKLTEITQLDWVQIESIVETGELLDEAIDQGTLSAAGNALQDVINLWSQDEAVNQLLDKFGLNWEQLGKVAKSSQDIGAALEANNPQVWQDTLKALADIWDEDEKLETALKNKISELTRLDWAQIDKIITTGELIDDAIDQKSWKGLGSAIKDIVDLWKNDGDVKQALRKSELNWTQLGEVSQQGDTLSEALETGDSLDLKTSLTGVSSLLEKDQDLKSKLKEKIEDITGLEWTQIEQILKSIDILDDAFDQQNLTVIGNAFHEVIDLWRHDQDLNNALQNIGLSWEHVGNVVDSSQRLAIAVEADDSDVWQQTLKDIIGIWDQNAELEATLKQKISEATQLDWGQIEQWLETGKIFQTFVDVGDISSVGHALNDVITLWQQDEDATQRIQEVGLSWEQLGKVAQMSQKLGEAIESENSDVWQQNIQDIVEIWAQDQQLKTRFQDRLGELTSVSWEQVQRVVATGKVIDRVIDDPDLQSIGAALSEVITLWRTDENVTQALNKLDINWDQLGQLSQTTQQLGTAIASDDSEIWKNTIEEVFEIWHQDEQLEAKIKSKLDDFTNVDWQTIYNFVDENIISKIVGDDNGNRLLGSDRNDHISGNAGNDSIRGGLGADILDGGAGIGRLDYTTSNTGVTVNLGSMLVSGGHAEGDSITDFENVLGSKHRDQLTGNAGKNLLGGRHGNDILVGGGGNDILRGDQGADVLTGGSGANTFKYKGQRDSLLSNFDHITDLKIGIDHIDSPIKVSTKQVAQLLSVRSLEVTDLKSLLSRGAFRPNRAATFTYNHQTFLAINDDKAGFQTHKDSVIEITGFSGELNNLSIA